MPLTDDVVVRRKTSPRAEATDRRRAQIIDAAINAFAESGYNATSLRDIAARAGLSHTGLLHHFPDKPGLLEAALDQQFQNTDAEFDFTSSDGSTVLRALIGSAKRDMGDPTTLRFLVVVTAEALDPGHPAHGFMLDIRRRVRARLTETFENLNAQGAYRSPLSPALAAAQTMALRDGAILEWLFAPDEFDLIEILSSHLRSLADVQV